MRQRPTLLRHLLLWALGALLVVWAAFVFVGYRTGVHEADELTDGQLASAVALLLGYRGGDLASRSGPHSIGLPASTELKSHDYQQSLSVVVWDTAGQVLSHTGAAPLPAFDRTEGFANLMLGPQRTEWRAFSRWDPATPQRKLMVLLSLQERDALAADIAGQIAEPGLWLLPVIAIALGLAIRRGLKPLHRLSQEVGTLDVDSGRTLVGAQRHAEFEAVVQAINVLVERQQATLQRERQLTGELAHELRTPLASLSLNARALRGTLTLADRDAALQRLDSDSLRTAQVLSHLLALARASRTEMLEAARPLELLELARGVIADMAPAAAARGQELALSGGAFAVPGHAVLLELALRNLIENALDHTASGSLIEVSLEAGTRRLCVSDNGTGAPLRALSAAPALGLGLGLGHRVVEKIASIHNARFSACDPPPAMTTCYAIDFGAPHAPLPPVAAPAAAATAIHQALG